MSFQYFRNILKLYRRKKPFIVSAKIPVTSGSLLLSLLTLVVVFFTACKDDEYQVPAMNEYLKYFPLQEGSWIEYSGDSVVHRDDDDAYHVDTSISQYVFSLRDEVDSAFVDGEGDTAHIIFRFRRENDTLPWTLSAVWSAKVSSVAAQRTEDNIRFIKLSFPFSSRKRWNGNAYNFFPEEIYSYQSLHQSLTVGQLPFDSTVTVVQNDFESGINRIYKREIYAADVGMVEKQIDSVRTEFTSNGTIILNGLEYRLTITGFGQ